MRILGRTERRVVGAILVTALIPLVASILIARAVIARVSATAFQPEFGAHLDQALEVYAELATAIKQGMRAEADAIAAGERLRRSAFDGGVEGELERAFAGHPSLVSLRIEGCDGEPRAARDRGRPVDPAREKTLTVRKALARAEGERADVSDCDERPDDVRVLVATFATEGARFTELEGLQAFAQAYHELERERREDYLDRTYANAFAALLAATIGLAIVAGVLVVRPVVRRIARLAAATRPVAEGDLTVRVGLDGDDEVADLGRAFDRMLEELTRSRARIEFLRRIGEWQKMARRLAHEIKNPLTPIQLAVQECHRRYGGGDPAYERLLQTTLEVVEEEVGTLRRLVGEFSSFARLPRAELAECDLAGFLRDQGAHLAATEAAGRGADGEDALLGRVEISFDVPEAEMPAAIDREMLHRALTNMVRNAAQALRDARGGPEPQASSWGRIRVSAREDGAQHVIDVDDDGPGIDPLVRDTVFDPYVTTKRDGTGLGLSIVKKIIVDHGGTIDVLASPLGGARFEIRLPRAGSAEARAAMERSAEARGKGERGDGGEGPEAAPPPSSGPS
ncbi:MAG: HAMP domain-containing protein [Polyangiaceae bacterium]|nr:HAMP domain-containing protein [Polyangiaceae bacterium]